MEDDRGPGFAPTDLTDSRERWDWSSKWDKAARRWIRVEAIYLAMLFLCLVGTMLLVWKKSLQIRLKLDDATYRTFEKYAMALLSGTLGGLVFGIKYFYHVVAHGRWHKDRVYWRLGSPFISGAVAFVTVVLIRADFVPILDRTKFDELTAIVGVAFVFGYFSDLAIGVLANFAERVSRRSRQGDGPGGAASSSG